MSGNKVTRKAHKTSSALITADSRGEEGADRQVSTSEGVGAALLSSRETCARTRVRMRACACADNETAFEW